MGLRKDCGSTLDDGISEASFSPMLEKCGFSSLAILAGSVIVCSQTLMSEMLLNLSGFRANNSLSSTSF